jgi:hypothetical protein
MVPLQFDQLARREDCGHIRCDPVSLPTGGAVAGMENCSVDAIGYCVDASGIDATADREPPQPLRKAYYDIRVF